MAGAKMNINPRPIDIPFGLRVAGVWLIWGAWCAVCGWTLSALHLLNGWGHLLASPGLFVTCWLWWRATRPQTPVRSWRHRRAWMFRPLPLFYAGTALLSLIGAVSYAPWSFDSTTYRLPRLLDWWAANHWYWIGTVDHRLDFSSCGFEWQMLPLLELTHSDRGLFLLNWLPYLMAPGLIFFVFRSLGVNARSARRWMWLLPMGYCYALQCGGLQNDGYCMNFTLAAVGFAVAGYRSGRTGLVLISLLAAGLITGAKLSNAPLLLPLGLFLLPALSRVNLWNWKTPVTILAATLASFLPLAFLCWKMTGDWTGDPDDQWNVRAHGALGALVPNALSFLDEATQPPVFARTFNLERLYAFLQHILSPIVPWLPQAHSGGGGTSFGMAYEGNAGLGFGVGTYVILLLIGCWFIKPPQQRAAGGGTLPMCWRLALLCAWPAYAVMLMKLGGPATPRIGAPFYPLLLISLLRLSRIGWFERRQFTAWLAIAAALMVVPSVVLTPARPLLPSPVISWLASKPSLSFLADRYRHWTYLRDPLAPLRAVIPAEAKKLGYAGGFKETPYGLWKPIGSREIVELGLPLGGKAGPPPDLHYAVVTEAGLQARYGADLETWCRATQAEVVFQFEVNRALTGHEPGQFSFWALVKFNR